MSHGFKPRYPGPNRRLYYPGLHVRACLQMALCGAAGGAMAALVTRWLS